MADASEEALKKKFQQLQSQQHEKLEKRKKKKQRERQKTVEAVAVNGTLSKAEKSSSSAFGINDELDLKVGNTLEM